MDLQDLFNAFVQHGNFLKNWSPKTVATYTVAFASFQQSLHVAELNCDEATVPGAHAALTKAQLEAWIVCLRTRRLSPGACNVYIRAMNSFCSWLAEEGHIPARVKLKLLPNPRKPLRGLSDAEVKAIVAFRPSGFYQLRTWTLLCALLDTGIRINEALTLQAADVNLDELVLTVVGKGNKTRQVPFSVELRKHLYRYANAKARVGFKNRWFFEAHSGEKLRYRNVYRDLKALCAAAGVSGSHIRPHLFRHCFAVSYVRAGGDVYRLSRFLGHTSISTTQIYLRSMGVEMLAENHSELSPLSRLGGR